MSITIDYFFNSDLALLELAGEINLWIGCQLAPYEGDPEDYYCRLLGMEFDLHKHDLENDGEVDYENYCYQIGIRTPLPDADFRPLQLPTMAFVIYALYRRLKITGVLVFDLQILLARYSEQSNTATISKGLFDEVSNDFVSFPKHINDLLKQAPPNSLSGAWEAATVEYLEAKGKHIEIPG